MKNEKEIWLEYGQGATDLADRFWRVILESRPTVGEQVLALRILRNRLTEPHVMSPALNVAALERIADEKYVTWSERPWSDSRGRR